MNRIVAIDCGGTGSRGIVVDESETIVARAGGASANLHTAGALAAARVIADLVNRLPSADALALAMAGLRGRAERQALLDALRLAGMRLPAALYSDSEAALRSSGRREGVVVVAGTGASAYARGFDGSEARAGGWGPILGDEGGGYWLGRLALSRAIRAWDEGDLSGCGLLKPILDELGVGQVEEIRGVASAPGAPARLAALAPMIASLRQGGNEGASRIVEEAAREIARLVRLAAGRVQLPVPCPTALSGGLSRAIPDLGELVQGQLGAEFAVRGLEAETSWGAYLLAREDDRWDRMSSHPLSPTEVAHPETAAIDSMATLEMLRVMNHIDEDVVPAVAACLPHLAELVDEAARRLKRGGRLIYLGAGTSGRLAVLDAAECVPTFGVQPGKVAAIIAGGEASLTQAVEGAEDDADAAASEIDAAGVTDQDVVVGVSASGRATFVSSGVRAARDRGAFTAVVSCNPGVVSVVGADVHVIAEVGPEVIAGSTRLKAGTAQKLILNMLSTAVMIRLGRTRGNRMTYLRPTNNKLRERAVRLVSALSGVEESDALQALKNSDWSVEDAVQAIGELGHARPV